MLYRPLSLALLLTCVAITYAAEPTPAALDKKIAINLPDADLETAVKTLGERTGLSVFFEKGEQEGIWRTSLYLAGVENIHAHDLLKLFAERYQFSWRVEDRTLKVRSISFWPHAGNTILRIYNVDDLTDSVADLGAWDCMGITAQKDDPVRDPVRVDAATTPTLTNIADMIRNRVRPDQWDAALGTSIEERGGKLVVMQSEAVHAEIRALLSAFRNKRNRQVAIDARFYSVKSTDVDLIRADADARNVPAPELDATALKALDDLVKNGVATQLFAGSGLGHNQQDLWIQNLKQTRQVVDYNISGGQYEAVVRTRYNGASVQCEPLISDDGQTVLIRLRASYAVPYGVEELLITRGGTLQKAISQESTVTVSQKVPTAPAQQAALQPAETAPQPAKPANDEKLVEIQKQEPARILTQAVPGPLHCQLLSVGHSRIRQNFRVRAGKTLALSMPQYGPKGIEPGRELLLVLRTDVLRPGVEKMETPRNPPPPESEFIAAQLAKPVTLKLEVVPAQAALEALSKAAALPLLLDHTLLSKARETTVSIDARERPAREILQQILGPIEGDTLACNSFMLVVKSDEVMARRTTLYIYDVREMTTLFSDYVSNFFNLPADLDKMREGLSLNSYGSGLQAADLGTLLKERYYPRDFTSPATAIEESGGKLVVLATPETQAKITKKLDELRHQLLRSIALTTRWAVVDTAALEAALGRNLPAVLTASQVAKVRVLISQNSSRDISAARFVSQHEQRSYSFGVFHRDTILNYSISPEGLYDPEAWVYSCGALADIRPSIVDEIDGVNHIRLDIRTMLSFADPKPQHWDPLNPKSPKAPLAANAAEAPAAAPNTTGALAPGHFHNPANEYARFLTSVTIPDGGAALFRATPPAWIEGENPEAIKKGERTLIMFVQATQQRLEKNAE